MNQLLGIEQKILLVEDDPTVARTTLRVLDDDARVFQHVSDVASAIAAMKSESFDLILSDYELPDGLGATVLAYARDLQPDAPRILVTSHTDWQTAQCSINAGELFRIVAKPWTDGVIRSVVEQGLALKRLRDEHAELRELTKRQQRELAEANASLVAKTLILERQRAGDLRALVSAVAVAIDAGVRDRDAMLGVLAGAFDVPTESLVGRADRELDQLVRAIVQKLQPKPTPKVGTTLSRG